MPIIKSKYKAPFGFRSGHLQTIYAATIRKADTSDYKRERIETSDGDFLDLDWIPVSNAERCVIITHGLEGSSDRSYATNLSQFFAKQGYTTCAWNFRGCSGEVNRREQTYYSGDIIDLQTVISHVAKQYNEIYLIGLSLGGNKSLKYLGEMAGNTHPAVKACVVYSVPADLKACSIHLEKRSNTVYRKRFIKKLKEKLEAKEKQFPGVAISTENYDKIKTLRDYDDYYSSHLFNFKDSDDYYQQCSCKRFIPAIKLPTLIVNAIDDPFLSDDCYPTEECKNHKHVTLEMPANGGHVGFVIRGDHYYSEKRSLEFFESVK